MIIAIITTTEGENTEKYISKNYNNRIDNNFKQL